MGENRAVVADSRAVAKTAIALVTIVAISAMAACGGDSGDTKPEESTKPGNPGLLFSGTYKVDTVTKTINGELPKPANGPATASYTWVVQSTCDGPGDTCVAVAAATAPDPKRSLNLERMEFVYEKGAWSRTFVPNPRDCTSNSSRQPVKEPWVAMHTTTLKSPAGTAPLPSLTGDFVSLSGGTCGGEALGTVTLTRTGDVPEGTKPLPKTVAPAVVADPPGAAWRGTYDSSAKAVSANPPSFLKAVSPFTERFTMTPVCTRSGEQCVVAARFPTGSKVVVWGYAGGGYDLAFDGATIKCTNGQEGYTHRTFRYTPAANATAPIANLTLKEQIDYIGPCAGKVQVEGTAIRTGE